MALYTIFAWIAVVIAGGAYYWIYIRREPVPFHLFGLTAKATSAPEDIVRTNPRRRKHREAPKRRAVSGSNDESYLKLNPNRIKEEEIRSPDVSSRTHEPQGLGLSPRGIFCCFLVLTNRWIFGSQQKTESKCSLLSL
jgi:hypothetical protein